MNVYERGYRILKYSSFSCYVCIIEQLVFFAACLTVNSLLLVVGTLPVSSAAARRSQK